MLNSNALPVTASSEEHISMPCTGSGDGAPSTGLLRTRTGTGAGERRFILQSICLSMGLFFHYLYTVAWGAPCCIHPPPQQAPAAAEGGWEAATKPKMGREHQRRPQPTQQAQHDETAAVWLFSRTKVLTGLTTASALIIRQLQLLKVDKAPGPNELSPQILQAGAQKKVVVNSL